MQYDFNLKIGLLFYVYERFCVNARLCATCMPDAYGGQVTASCGAGVELRINSATRSHRYESQRTCSLPVMVTVNCLTRFIF